jgi:hypothetical protein
MNRAIWFLVLAFLLQTTASWAQSVVRGGQERREIPEEEPMEQGLNILLIKAALDANSEIATVNMIIVMDRSGSMSGALWASVKSELSEFFIASSSSNVNVGMNYFPVEGADDQCNAAEYNPIQVPFGELTAYSSALLVEFENQTPSFGATSTYPALYGSLAAATGFKDTNPEKEVIVVLISDGPASECNTDIDDIAGLASASLNYNGVRTYVIAIQGAPVSAFDVISAAGGTGQAYDVSPNISLLRVKMEEIRVDAISP